MKTRFERPEDLPGQRQVTWRPSGGWIALAAVLGIAWPPLILTFIKWPPQTWIDGLNTDWRILVLAVGVVAVPACLWLLAKERERTGRPATRLGIVWRFMFYGGLLAAALQAFNALVLSGIGAARSADIGQALGYAETALLIFGVGGVPLAILVGISYALWAGLCAAFLAFMPRNAPVRNRLGVMGSDAG
ncbi:phthalate transporter [Brevundimonas sp. A19_0]|uniref:phthalate transporter n=1 Tax=Brevundimonas sp. A19_0 TaxID=2821087 RepID=UPI001ADC5241|nr:phthalate transporter [Brevundimonas sp. A19_0]MBO9502894.1 phthalate transporter [Brevundimonas sp. A19_0]